MGKKCAGVRFIYPPMSTARVTFQEANGKAGLIAAVDAAPFDNLPVGLHKVALYRFGDWPAQGEIVAAQRPLFIGLCMNKKPA